jgi:Putative Actinobacterial Holin-X, holin superfamily III
MELPDNLIESLFERIDAYLKTTIELAKLRATAKGVSLATTLLVQFCAAVMAMLFLLFLSIGAALFLGDLCGKWHYGFFIVAGFYLFFGLFSHFYLYKLIRKPISKFIITQTLK